MFDHIHNHFYESPLEVCEYNPKKDVLAIFVGNEDDIPSPSIMEDIHESLEKINKECTLLVAPGVFRIVVLKGAKNK